MIMNASTWRCRLAMRSIGKLLKNRIQPHYVRCQPQGCCVKKRAEKFLNERKNQGLLLTRQLPTTMIWDGQHQQEQRFLSVGTENEDNGLSKRFEENRIFGYTLEQVYDVVACIDLYEEFVPWCLKSKVLTRKENKMDAELEIGFKMFVEKYTSHVEFKPPNLIKSSVSNSALFDHLNNEWHFKPGPSPNSCHLHFMVDFQFKSVLYRQVAHLFFSEVQAQLVGSFEDRCKVVYGPSLETTVRKKDEE